MRPIFTFWKISTANLRILWRHLPTELWNILCVVKHIQSSNSRRKHRPNQCIIGDAILPQTGKIDQKCDPEFGGLLWRHLTPHRKKRNIGAQLQSLRCIKAPKIFWKIYSLYDFWCAQTCSFRVVFRLDALALSVIATATWLGGWLGGCHTPVLYQNR